MKLYIIFIPVLLTASCTKENKLQTTSSQWPVISVEGPVSGEANQPVTFMVSYPTSSGCDVLDTFIQTNMGNSINIKAFGHTNTGMCIENAAIKTKDFIFMATDTGNFQLHFINPDSTFIEQIISIH